MEEQRVTDELYKIAVEKGFVPNKTASMYVVRQNGNHFSTDGPEWKKEKPTLSLLQKHLREKHWLHINITKESIGSDEKVYAYEIEYLPKEFWEAKRHVKHLVYIESFYEGMGSYGGGWDTYEEALESALQEALKII